MQFVFNVAKATQAAARLLESNGGSMDMYILIKMLYIMDRESLERWGEPVTGDKPVSMEHGPVLSTIYDLTKGTAHQHREIWSNFIGDADEQTNQVSLRDNPGRDELSNNEICLLVSVFERFKNFTWRQMKEHCHQFKEYDESVGKSSKSITFEEILSAVGKTPDEVRELSERANNLRVTALLMSLPNSCPV